jgi:hypothetical protein
MKSNILEVSTSTYNELRGLLEEKRSFFPQSKAYMPDFRLGGFIFRHKVKLDEAEKEYVEGQYVEPGHDVGDEK